MPRTKAWRRGFLAKSVTTTKHAFGNHRWNNVVASSLTRMKANRVNVAAAAFAYRWFLSIFPTIIALLGIASLVSMPQHVVVTLIHGVSRALPASAASVFSDAITHASQRTSGDLAATVLASVVALWSALSGMVIVEEGLDMAYGIASDRSFISKRVVAAFLLLGGVTLGGSATALIVFGAPLGTLVQHALPFSGDTFPVLWTILRWVLALVLIHLLFLLLYFVAPNQLRGEWRWTSLGAIVATSLWAIVSLGFSVYTSNFSSYDRTYGVFAGVAILIFWLYLTGLAILVGGEVNAAVERSRMFVRNKLTT
ncbi:MAG: YihY/virulence factor BrkB family protein [Acidimicrobiales bacterium]